MSVTLNFQSQKFLQEPTHSNDVSKNQPDFLKELVGKTVKNHQKYDITFTKDLKERIVCICKKDEVLLGKDIELIVDPESIDRNPMTNPYALTFHIQHQKVVLGDYGLKGGMNKSKPKSSAKPSSKPSGSTYNNNRTNVGVQGNNATVGSIHFHGNNSSNQGDPPIVAAARSGSFESVKELKTWGASVNAINPNTGETVLIAAARSGNLELVKYLKTWGASINATSKTGETPLSAAAASGNPEVVKYLRTWGAK